MTDAPSNADARQPEGDGWTTPTVHKRWFGRHWPHILVGAVPGAFFGVTTGTQLSQGGLGAAFLPVVDGILVGVPIVILLLAGAIAKRAGPGIGALALGGAFLVGVALAPAAAGSAQHAPGTGEVAPAADAAANWSGSVTCAWGKDIATAVESVRWFHVPIADPAFQAIRLPDGSVEVSVFMGSGTLGYEDGLGGFQTLGLVILSRSADGRSGTAMPEAGDFPGWSAEQNARVAALRDGGVVFRWSCEGGP